MKNGSALEEMDAVLQSTGADSDREGTSEIAVFDFSQLDRIPKSQLRTLHLIHENFVRNLASSLSAYLRSYVALNFVSLEQIPYSEFLESLAFPTCMAYVAMAPYDGTAVLELNMTLMFTFLEILMGSKGRSTVPTQRKITDIEKSIMQTLLRVVLQDLSFAWKSLAEIDFKIQSLASEPQLTQVLSAADPVIVVVVDVRVGSISGLMNFAISSSFIKRLRHKFDQLQQVRKAHASEKDQANVAALMQDVMLDFEARVDGGTVTAQALLGLQIEDVLIFDHPMDQSLNGLINGLEKWSGNVGAKRDRLVFEVAAISNLKPA